LQSVNPGFDPQNLLTMELSLRGPDYQDDAPVINFYDQLLAKIKALPGVEAVGIRRYVPIAADEDFAYLSFMVEGRVPDPANRPIAYYNVVSPDLFRTMDIPFTRGRPFDAHDVMKAQNVIIINETLARRYFPGQEPIGKRMTLNDETPNPKEEDWATIVGVVKDTKPRELNGEPVAEMYMPFAQDPHRSMAVMIRTTNKPADIVAAVRREVRELDSNLPIYSIRTMDSVISESIATPRFRTSLLAVFAIVALTLAMVGIYGVMSYSVMQRTHEIGIRMAIGAQPRDVFRMVLGQGMLLTVVGLAIGLVGALALTRLMTTMLFGIKPTDPATFVGVAVVLAMVAVIACYIPGRRATKVDPVNSLRYE
jgi:putative ABC transport system permease protein